MKNDRQRLLKVVLPIVTLAVGGLTAWALVKTKRTAETEVPETPPPLVRIFEVSLDDVTLSVEAQGTVEPPTETTLVAQVAGEVVTVSEDLAAGAFIERGQVLARIEPRDFQLALVRSEAEVARAEAILSRERAEAELAREEWQTLGDGRSPSPLVLREPQLKEAEASLAAAKAALEGARLDLERTEIRAPYDGRVREKHVDLGQFLTPGAPIARIYGTAFTEVKLPIADREIAFLSVPLRGGAQDGPQVELSAAFAGRTHRWLGRIVRTGGEIDPVSRMVQLVARVEDPYAPGPDAPERPPLEVGLFVDAEIAGRTVRNAAVVPRSAMRSRDELLVVDGESRLRFKQVEVLYEGEDTVVITGGLEAGERVCLSQLSAPTEGMRVRVREEMEAPATPLALDVAEG